MSSLFFGPTLRGPKSKQIPHPRRAEGVPLPGAGAGDLAAGGPGAVAAHGRGGGGGCPEAGWGVGGPGVGVGEDGGAGVLRRLPTSALRRTQMDVWDSTCQGIVVVAGSVIVLASCHLGVGECVVCGCVGWVGWVGCVGWAGLVAEAKGSIRHVSLRQTSVIMCD